MKRNGCFILQTIINITEAHGAISDEVCVGSPVIIIIYKNSQQVHKKNFEFSTRVGTCHSFCCNAVHLSGLSTETSWSSP